MCSVSFVYHKCLYKCVCVCVRFFKLVPRCLENESNMVRTPKLDQLGRAYSEMSPLNPPLSAHSTATTSSAAGGHERRDSGGYGSIFPFGFFRSSFGRSGNSIQVGKQRVFFHSIRHMFRCLTVVCLCVRLGLSDKRYRYSIPYAIHTYIHTYIYGTEKTHRPNPAVYSLFVCWLQLYFDYQLVDR